jgi:predicted lipoprotein with Yx(FWY)xxD motif
MVPIMNGLSTPFGAYDTCVITKGLRMLPILWSCPRGFLLLLAGSSLFMVSSFIWASEPSSRLGPAVVQMTEFGPVLANEEGRTLYSWPRDRSTPGRSQCTDEQFSKYRHVTGVDIYFPRPESRGSCVDKWPPFLASESAKASGDWSLIERDDGSIQWAYRGLPLHTSVKDQRPGEVNGLSVKVNSYGGWEPVSAPLDMPPGVKLLRTSVGVVMATEDDRPLYTRSSDQCEGCVGSEPLVAGALIDRIGEWSVVKGTGGIRQYAFRGTPVYVGKNSLSGISGSRLEEPDGWKAVIYRHAAPVPPEIETQFSLIGDIYTNSDGMALYVFHCESGNERLPCDDPGEAAAYWSIICGAPEVCAERWRPFVAGPGASASGEWTITTIPHPVYSDSKGLTYDKEDNSSALVRAWAFRGRPTYTFTDDLEPAQILGHRIGGLPGSSFYAIRVPGNNDPALAR